MAWKGAKRYAAAVVVALFPVVFLLDHAVHWSFSPVLPGLLVLAVAVLALPMALMEFVRRRARHRASDVRRLRAERLARHGRWALVLAFAWLAGWFTWGIA